MSRKPGELAVAAAVGSAPPQVARIRATAADDRVAAGGVGREREARRPVDGSGGFGGDLFQTGDQDLLVFSAGQGSHSQTLGYATEPNPKPGRKADTKYSERNRK